MRYVVDGYNLLFRALPLLEGIDIRRSREKLIPYLDKVASKSHLDIIVVFDSNSSDEDARRGHFHAIEVVYTARGLSADRYIQEFCRINKSCTAVTSDKKLAASVSHGRVKTMTVEAFLIFLTKKAEKAMTGKAPKEALPARRLQTGKRSGTQSEFPPLSDIDAWIKIFTKT